MVNVNLTPATLNYRFSYFEKGSVILHGTKTNLEQLQHLSQFAFYCVNIETEAFSAKDLVYRSRDAFFSIYVPMTCTVVRR